MNLRGRNIVANMVPILSLLILLIQSLAAKDVRNDLIAPDIYTSTNSGMVENNRTMFGNPNNVLKTTERIKVSRGPLRQMFPKYKEIPLRSSMKSGYITSYQISEKKS